MEAILETLAMVLLMLGALFLLARSWPRSSRRTGYRTWMRDASRDTQSEAQERGEANREDDDVHWHWPDTRDGDDA